MVKLIRRLLGRPKKGSRRFKLFDGWDKKLGLGSPWSDDEPDVTVISSLNSPPGSLRTPSQRRRSKGQHFPGGDPSPQPLGWLSHWRPATPAEILELSDEELSRRGILEDRDRQYRIEDGPGGVPIVHKLVKRVPMQTGTKGPF